MVTVADHFADIGKMVLFLNLHPQLARPRLLHQALLLRFEGVQLPAQDFDFPIN